MNKRLFIFIIGIIIIGTLQMTDLVNHIGANSVQSDTEKVGTADNSMIPGTEIPVTEREETEDSEESRELVEVEKPGEYDSYLRKIWVEESWDGGCYTGMVSFYFTEIEEGKIEGKIMPGAIAEPEYILYRNPEDILPRDRAVMFDLYGDIVDGTGQCFYLIPPSTYYNDENGERVRATDVIVNKLEIRFQEDGKLFIGDGKTLRPYCLSDIAGYIEKAYSCAFSNEVWDDCFFTVIQTQNEDGKCPDVYLTDVEDHVLYHFNSLYQTDSEVEDMQMEDVNADGLTDIRLFTGYVDDDPGPIDRVFLQNADGTFQEEILRSYLPAGQGIIYGDFGDGETSERSDFVPYEKLAHELQEAIRNQTIDAVLQTGTGKLRSLSEHEVQNLKYLDVSGSLNNYHYVYGLQYIRDGQYEWYALEQNEERMDIWVREGNGYTFYDGYRLEKGRLRCRMGIPLAMTDELYFMEFDGLYYPCIPTRNDEGVIVSVSFYTFETPTINGGCMVISADEIMLLGYAI